MTCGMCDLLCHTLHTLVRSLPATVTHLTPLWGPCYCHTPHTLVRSLLLSLLHTASDKNYIIASNEQCLVLTPPSFCNLGVIVNTNQKVKKLGGLGGGEGGDRARSPGERLVCLAVRQSYPTQHYSYTANTTLVEHYRYTNLFNLITTCGKGGSPGSCPVWIFVACSTENWGWGPERRCVTLR